MNKKLDLSYVSYKLCLNKMKSFVQELNNHPRYIPLGRNIHSFFSIDLGIRGDTCLQFLTSSLLVALNM